ncbi:hypothetical protein llap_18446 [Limosa lapponica baueri]|uniref:Uncharacterized protein n=1 Tax=Limosa lapponica baueri TaxID=1758121 RepID=A0A2I0TBQ8_LIMLA|nr:hypothetical protein llap_18446 [Limosa lapponica baueri]
MEMATSHATNFPPTPTQFKRRLFFETSIECSSGTILETPRAIQGPQPFTLPSDNTTVVGLHKVFPSRTLYRVPPPPPASTGTRLSLLSTPITTGP